MAKSGGVAALRQWAEKERLNLSALAMRLGFPIETTRRYLEGLRVPRPGEMTRIYLATRGAVTPNDFYDLPALPRPEEAEAA